MIDLRRDGCDADADADAIAIAIAMHWAEQMRLFSRILSTGSTKY